MRWLLAGALVAWCGCDCRGGHLADVYDAGCSVEVCDGRDNDCDGEVDEELGELTCGVGACVRTVATCADGVEATCAPGSPSQETCNGVDDDCDGQVDEEQPASSCGVGVCARSDQPSCVDGTPVACVPGVATQELCDGLDNDCDGQVDNGACAPPQVTCPASMTVDVGVPQTLSAMAHDPDGRVTSVGWSVTSAPAGSQATPSPADAGVTHLTPDVKGTYTLSFCATDDMNHRACCETTLETAACATPPPPPVSTACDTSWDGRPIFQFAPVPSGLTYELAHAGNVLATASVGQNWMRPTARVAPGGPPPGLAVDFEVRACRTSDAACCSVVRPVSVNVVETCGTPVAPSTTTLVFSEYIINGEGTCPSTDCTTHDTCQAGEAIELTNLSNCPLSLDGHHFAYRNATAATASLRWMNFGAADVIPPRGVYVAIRGRAYAPTCSAPLPPERATLFGLKISALQMQGANLCSGWFNNTGGGLSELQVAPGAVAPGSTPVFTPGSSLARVGPYLPVTGNLASCVSVGFNAVDSCGSVTGGSVPTSVLNPNQLGRLWHPCDAVPHPVPACPRN